MINLNCSNSHHLNSLVQQILVYAFLFVGVYSKGVSQVAPKVKNTPANAGDKKDVGLIPGYGRSLGVGNGDPLQYSCLENSMDKGPWRAAVHGNSKSQTQLSTNTHRDYQVKDYCFL